MNQRIVALRAYILNPTSPLADIADKVQIPSGGIEYPTRPFGGPDMIGPYAHSLGY